MGRRWLLVFLAGIACCAQEAESTETEEEVDYDSLCPIGEPEAESTEEKDFRDAFLVLWNEARAEGGSCAGDDVDPMDPLEQSEAMDAFSRCLVADISENDFDYYTDSQFSDGSDLEDVMDDYGFGASTTAISGVSDAEGLIEYLLEESEDGCEDIFDERADEAGIAVESFRSSFFAVLVRD